MSANSLSSEPAAPAAALAAAAPKTAEPKIEKKVVEQGSSFGQRLASFFVGTGVGFG